MNTLNKIKEEKKKTTKEIEKEEEKKRIKGSEHNGVYSELRTRTRGILQINVWEDLQRVKTTFK